MPAHRSPAHSLPGVLPLWLALLLAVALIAGCGGGSDDRATRTPVPTWTPTPMGALPPAAPAQPGEPVVLTAPGAATLPPAAPVVEAPPPTAVVVAEAATPVPAPTEIPAATPTPMPTVTPIPTATPAPPTETPTPAPTPTPNWAFELEEAAQFPTLSLAPNVVRIWLYVYSPAELALGDYTLSVLHNGAPLTVDEISSAGLPTPTRAEPGPYTRFTNMNVIFIEPQEGTWEVQLIDADGLPAGPPASFVLSADQLERELYVRYKQVRPL